MHYEILDPGSIAGLFIYLALVLLDIVYEIQTTIIFENLMPLESIWMYLEQ